MANFRDKKKWLERHGDFNIINVLEPKEKHEAYWLGHHGGLLFSIDDCKSEKDGVTRMYLKIKQALFEVCNGDTSHCPLRDWRSVL